MDDKVWYYNYFKKFIDTPAIPARSRSSPASSETPLPREKEGDAGESSRAPETVTTEASVVSNSPAVEGSTPVKKREKVLFGKAPPALLAVIKRPGKGRLWTVLIRRQLQSAGNAASTKLTGNVIISLRREGSRD
jgi:hypothetical protein